MISKEEARKQALLLVKNNHGDFLTVSEIIDDFGDLYITYVNSIEYFKTNDESKSLVGIGPLIIDKENGYTIIYGSANSGKTAAEKYRKLKADWLLIKQDFPQFDIKTIYNIEIVEIYDLNKLSDLIISFPFVYTIPEIEGDTIWRIPKKYNKKTLSDRFKRLPIKFMDIDAERVIEFYKSVIKHNLCLFNIETYIEETKEWNINRADTKDLEPKW